MQLHSKCNVFREHQYDFLIIQITQLNKYERQEAFEAFICNISLLEYRIKKKKKAVSYFIRNKEHFLYGIPHAYNLSMGNIYENIICIK